MIDAIDAKLTALEGATGGRGRGRRGPRTQEQSLGRVAGEFGRLLAMLQGADATPTTQATAAVTARGRKNWTACLPMGGDPAERPGRPQHQAGSSRSARDQP